MDAWDMKPESSRIENTIENFIVFCEDSVSEPGYLNDLQKEHCVKVNPITDQKANFHHYVNAVQYCVDHDLAEAINGGMQIKPGINSHLWCVYDRDAEHPDPAMQTQAGKIAFSQSIQNLERDGFKVAWSNDVFELWILLHFEDVDPSVWLSRDNVYARLTAVFKALPGQSAEMLSRTSKAGFDFKGFSKNKTRFDTYVKPWLAARRADAIARAKTLVAHFPAASSYHERNPCTMFYQLTESILSYH